jgi:hypothetical protein
MKRQEYQLDRPAYMGGPETVKGQVVGDFGVHRIMPNACQITHLPTGIGCGVTHSIADGLTILRYIETKMSTLPAAEFEFSKMPQSDGWVSALYHLIREVADSVYDTTKYQGYWVPKETN